MATLITREMDLLAHEHRQLTSMEIRYLRAVSTVCDRKNHQAH